MTPEGSTHVDTVTGTTSSFSRTATGKVAVVAVIANWLLPDGAVGTTDGGFWDVVRTIAAER